MNNFFGAAASVFSIFSGGEIEYSSITNHSDCMEVGGYWYVESLCLDRYRAIIEGPEDEEACKYYKGRWETIYAECWELSTWERYNAKNPEACYKADGVWIDDVASSCSRWVVNGYAIIDCADEACCSSNAGVWTAGNSGYCAEPYYDEGEDK